MGKPHAQHHSFVVRIWWEDDAMPTQVWRGWIQYAATGETAYVGTFQALVAFIEGRTGKLAELSGGGASVPARGCRTGTEQVEI